MFEVQRSSRSLDCIRYVYVLLSQLRGALDNSCKNWINKTCPLPSRYSPLLN